MALINEFNFAQLAQQQLENVLKPVLVDRLISEHLARYEDEIRPLIEKEVEKVSLGVIRSAKEFANLRDEIQVYIKINDDEPKSHLLK